MSETLYFESTSERAVWQDMFKLALTLNATNKTASAMYSDAANAADAYILALRERSAKLT